MLSEKEKLVSKIKKLVVKIIKEKLTEDALSNEQEYLNSFLNITSQELDSVITFIADILPEKLYLDRYENIKEYSQTLIAEELLMFLVQEDINSPHFKNILMNFREEMLSIISSNVYLDENNNLFVAR